MAQPTPYDPSFDFSDFSALNPDIPQPGVSLDAQFNAIKLTTDETLANLALIQRDDGLLANGIVTADSLSDELYAGISRAIPWATATAYEPGDLLWYLSKLYSVNAGFTGNSTTNPTVDTTRYTQVLDMTATVPDIITQEAQDAADAAAASASAAAASAADIEDIVGSVNYLWAGTSTGAANTIVLAPVPGMTSYAVGHKLRFLVGTTNTGAVTMNTDNALGSRSISKNIGAGLVALTAGDLLINTIAEIEYISDAIGYQLLNVVFSPATITSQTSADVALDDVSVFSDTSDSGNLKKAQYKNILGLADLVPKGRLTLTSATPVTTADVTAATTLYYTPFKGNSISLYNGTSWDLYNFSQIPIAVPATTSQMYDVFVYDNAGTLTLDLTAWSSDTARATAITTQDGVYVKSGALGRRYVGSFRTTTVSGQTEDSAKARYVWNYYNRVEKNLRANDATASWTYATATFRAANSNTTLGQGRVATVVGVAEDNINAVYNSAGSNTGGAEGIVGIGINSTTTDTSATSGITGNANAVQVQAIFNDFLAVGFSYIQALEASTGATTTFYGTKNTFFRTGLTGKVHC